MKVPGGHPGHVIKARDKKIPQTHRHGSHSSLLYGFHQSRYQATLSQRKYRTFRTCEPGVIGLSQQLFTICGVGLDPPFPHNKYLILTGNVPAQLDLLQARAHRATHTNTHTWISKHPACHHLTPLSLHYRMCFSQEAKLNLQALLLPVLCL